VKILEKTIPVSRRDLLWWKLSVYKKGTRNFLNEFSRKKSALLGLGIFLVFFAFALFPGVFSLFPPDDIVAEAWQPPNRTHILGTDDMGRDMLSQIIYGSRNTLFIGFFAAFITVFIGSAIGILSGYYGGWIDAVLMRFTDFFLSIPFIPLMIILAYILKPSIWNLIIVIGITFWPRPGKLVRSQVLSLKERIYIKRARLVGCSDTRILIKYILVRVLPIAFASMIMSVAAAIASEAFLAWLGLAEMGTITWGNILYFSFTRGSFTLGAWWHFGTPGVCIVLVNIAFN
jgi:peptide/nickel transport system permease protein